MAFISTTIVTFLTLYQRWMNIATNAIYINNHRDIPHTPHLLDFLSTDNFGTNLSSTITSLN